MRLEQRLHKLGLRHDEDSNILICKEPSCLFGLQNPWNHIYEKHRASLGDLVTSEVKNWLDGYKVSSAPVPTSIIPRVEGLRVINGVKCPSCCYITGTEDEVKKHMRRAHRAPGNERQAVPTTFQHQSAQRWWSGALYFPVYDTVIPAHRVPLLDLYTSTVYTINDAALHTIDQRYSYLLR